MPMPNLNGQAAYTKLTSPYPGYINVRRDDDQITITLRQDARPDGAEGPTCRLQLTFAEWREFLQQITVEHRI